MTLRWADVDLDARTLLVRRNLSAGVETAPKGRRHRYVPLPDPALAARARLGARDEFITDEDYVIYNRWGRRLDVSALRRRYQRPPEQRSPSAAENDPAVVPVTKLHSRDQARQRLPCHDAAKLWRVRAGSQGRACGPRYARP